MEVRGLRKSNKLVHHKDTTFISVDATVDELNPKVDPDEHAGYTALLMWMPDPFIDLPQWKDTKSLAERLAILETILDLVRDGKGLPLLCIHAYTTRRLGYDLGRAFLDEYMGTNPDDVQQLNSRGKVRYRFGDRSFGELQSASMMTYALATTFLATAMITITKDKAFGAQDKKFIDFSVDNISGNSKWNLRLAEYLIENTFFSETVTKALGSSPYVDGWRVGVPIQNDIGGRKFTDVNEMPRMIAVDWFTKIASRYCEIRSLNVDELNESDQLILNICQGLKEKNAIQLCPIPPFHLIRDFQLPKR